MFLDHLCDKGLLPRTYKELLQLNNKNIAQLKYGANDLNRHFGYIP